MRSIASRVDSADAVRSDGTRICAMVLVTDVTSDSRSWHLVPICSSSETAFVASRAFAASCHAECSWRALSATSSVMIPSSRSELTVDSMPPSSLLTSKALPKSVRASVLIWV